MKESSDYSYKETLPTIMCDFLAKKHCQLLCVTTMCDLSCKETLPTIICEYNKEKIPNDYLIFEQTSEFHFYSSKQYYNRQCDKMRYL